MMVSASREAVFTSFTVANLFPFNVFSLSGTERNHRGLVPVNRVGGESGSSQTGQIPGHRYSHVCWAVVLMEKPFTRSPQFWAFSFHILSQSPQNLQVKFLIDSLSRRNEFPVHDSSNIEKNNEHHFHIGHTCLLLSVSVKWASSIGSKLVWSKGRTHSTNFHGL